MDHKINLDYRAVARGPAPRTGSAGALPMRGLVALGAVFIYPLVAPISPWLAVGLFLLANVLVDFTVAIRQRIPFPDLAIIYHFVVFFCASFVLYFYPPAYYYPNIRPERYHEYLSYAVPACGAVYLGIRIANWRLRTAPYNAALARADPPAWSRYAVPFVVIGCVFTPIALYLPTSGLSFVFLLISVLRWVGTFTLILSGKKTWGAYLAVVGALEFFIALRAGMFIDLILWSACAFLVVGYRFQWRGKALLILLVAASFLLLLQDAKREYRTSVYSNTENRSISDDISTFTDILETRVMNPDQLLAPERISTVLVRFNQGWILDEVMMRVPTTLPYAGGQTIMEGAVAALVPRIVVADKAQAGGRVLFETYTGRRLNARTSMSISTMSEMYVNYGTIGGIVGMLVYGLVLGLLYRWVATKAVKSPLWWAWAPFVGLWALKADEDFMNVLNWIVKGLLVLGVICWAAKMQSARRERVRVPARMIVGGDVIRNDSVGS